MPDPKNKNDQSPIDKKGLKPDAQAFDPSDDKKGLQPDPETLHTTDPQEHMKGPVSSTMQNIKENAEAGAESKQEADKRKEENM